MKRCDIVLAIRQCGVLPIFSHADKDIVIGAAGACAAAGIPAFEFTNRAAGALENFTALTATAAKKFPTLILGAGSIVDAETAALFIAAGARYIVGPSFNAQIARLCHRRGVSYVPGCGSVTEALAALEYGVDLVKLFPAKQLGGPAFIRAILGPCPWIPVLATGGVGTSAEELAEWFKAGVQCVGIGSELFPADAIASGNFSAVTERAKALAESVKKARQSA